MLDNKTRAAMYNDMLDLLQQGHVKKALETSNGVCLVGAADRAAWKVSDRSMSPKEVSHQIQLELREEILARYPLVAKALVHGEKYPGAKSEDGGIQFVENWNDIPWRRTRTVVDLIATLAKEAKEAAKDEMIAELEALVAELRTQKDQLEARIVALEAQNATLEQEVSYWRRVRQIRESRIAASELRNASSELSELDAHLDKVITDLHATVS